VRDADELMAWAVIVPLWGVSLWRLPAAVRHPRSRTLWAIFSTLAAAMTTRLTVVGETINRFTGLREASTLTKHLAGVVAVALLLRWVVSVVPGREDGVPEPTYRRLISSRPRRILTWAAVAVITAVFPLANLRAPADVEDGDFIFYQAGHLWGTLHLVLFYAYLVFGMVCASAMCAEAYRLDRSTTIGRCLGMMSVGCTCGAVYGIIRSVYLVVCLTQHQFIGGPEFLSLASGLSLVLCVALVCLGSLGPPFERLGHAMDTHAAINDLRLMWEEITRHMPEVILQSPRRAGRAGRGLPGRVADFWSWNSLDQRLRRRITEIHDAAHGLQVYLSEDLMERTRETAARLDLPPQAVPAYLLHVAIAAKVAGRPAADTSGSWRLLPAGKELHDDVVFLIPVGTMMRDPGTMGQLNRRLSG
jgi:hypothetical protein